MKNVRAIHNCCCYGRPGSSKREVVLRGCLAAVGTYAGSAGHAVGPSRCGRSAVATDDSKGSGHGCTKCPPEIEDGPSFGRLGAPQELLRFVTPKRQELASCARLGCGHRAPPLFTRLEILHFARQLAFATLLGEIRS